MLDIQCAQEKAIGTIKEELPNLDPFVKVCLACCAPGCTKDTPVVLHLSEALDAIVTCICNLEGRVKAAEKNADDAIAISNALFKTLSDPNTGFSALWTDYIKFKNSFQCKVANLQTLTQENIAVGKLNGCTHCITCPIYP